MSVAELDSLSVRAIVGLLVLVTDIVLDCDSSLVSDSPDKDADSDTVPAIDKEAEKDARLRVLDDVC